MRYRLERLRRRGDTATFSSNASSLRPIPGTAQLIALHRWITDAGALEDGEYLWKQTIRSAGRAAADTDMPSAQGTDTISNPGGIYSTSRATTGPPQKPAAVAGGHGFGLGPMIGTGGSLAAPPLPHHRTYGSV
jgi:hypothetical protein